MSSNSFPPNLLEDFARSLLHSLPHEKERLAREKAQFDQSSKARIDFASYHDRPFELASILWPSAVFADYQKEIVNSVLTNYDTIVVAGNELGKDYIAGFIVLVFFLTRTPCRIVTTSADGPQLEAVLWGEIRRFIQTSAIPLSHDEGGPLVINHCQLRKVLDKDGPTGVAGGMCAMSYVMARVAAKGEGMLGHHAPNEDGIPRSLMCADEASGVDDESWKASETWAHRRLAIGNPWPCMNFFKQYVKIGNVEIDEGTFNEEPNVDVSSNVMEDVGAYDKEVVDTEDADNYYPYVDEETTSDVHDVD